MACLAWSDFATPKASIKAYDSRLREASEYDKELRDSLVAKVTLAAFKKYVWLGQDEPRPFPESDDGPGLLFHEVSRTLADEHGVRDSLLSAIRDLKRQGRNQAQIKALQIELAKTEGRINRAFKFLTEPKRRLGGGRSR
jgi:hypothetical protein